MSVSNLNKSHDLYDKYIPFPYKLWLVINNKNYVIYWSKMGSTILINYTNLGEFLLKHKLLNIKYCSTFIKELNLYGFRKINRYKKINNIDYNKNDLVFEYEHRSFQRNRPDLLKLIGRTDIRKKCRGSTMTTTATELDMLENLDATICSIRPFSTLQHARENLRLILGQQALNKQTDLFLKQMPPNQLNIPVIEVPGSYFHNPMENIPKFVQEFLEREYDGEMSSECSIQFYQDFIPMPVDDIRSTAFDISRRNSIDDIPIHEITIEAPSPPPMAQNMPHLYNHEIHSSLNYSHSNSVDDLITVIDEPVQLIEEKFEIKDEGYDFQIINENMAPLECQVASAVSVEENYVADQENIYKNEYYAEPLEQESAKPIYQEMYFDQKVTLPLQQQQPEVHQQQHEEYFEPPQTVVADDQLPHAYASSFNQFDLPQQYDDVYAHDMLYDIHLPNESEFNPDYFNQETLQNVENAIENFFTQIRESIDILNN